MCSTIFVRRCIHTSPQRRFCVTAFRRRSAIPERFRPKTPYFEALDGEKQHLRGTFGLHTNLRIEEAFSSSATKYFISKINVSNTRTHIQRSTFHRKHNSVLGIPLYITQETLNSLEHNFSRTPDILQLAFPEISGNKKGFVAPKKALTQIGERVEADFFFLRYQNQ